MDGVHFASHDFISCQHDGVQYDKPGEQGKPTIAWLTPVNMIIGYALNPIMGLFQMNTQIRQYNYE